MTEIIREAAPADVPDILRIYAPFVENGSVSFEYEVPTEAQMAERIATTQAVAPWLVRAREGRVVAYAYAGLHRARDAYRWSVEVSAYVDGAEHRQGHARRLYEVLFELLCLQGFVMSYAGITLPNPASVGFHEAMGFTPIGVYPAVGHKGGAWHDVGWWSRPLRTLPADPAPPRRPADLRHEPAWQRLVSP